MHLYYNAVVVHLSEKITKTVNWRWGITLVFGTNLLAI